MSCCVTDGSPLLMASARSGAYVPASPVAATERTKCRWARMKMNSMGTRLITLAAITSTNQMTLPLGLATFQGAHQTEWTLLMAANVMSLIPMLCIFILAQRHFVRSVAATGLAGT